MEAKTSAASCSAGFALAKDTSNLLLGNLISPKNTTLHSTHHQFAKINGQAIGNKMSDFKIVTELGRGSYGVVYRVESLKDQLTYVLKKINLAHMKQKHQQAAYKEVQILKNLDHPHIIK